MKSDRECARARNSSEEEQRSLHTHRNLIPWDLSWLIRVWPGPTSMLSTQAALEVRLDGGIRHPV